MTRDEIMNMLAGREMDILIHKVIFEQEAMRVTEDEFPVFTSDREYVYAGDAWYYDEFHIEKQLPFYSSDMRAAWKVVDKMVDKYQFILDSLWGTDPQEKWCACLGRGMGDTCEEVIIHAPTPQLAICRAALLAVMEEQ